MSNIFGTYRANMAANDDWKHWCRLCAKEDARNINIFPEGNENASFANSNDGNIQLLEFIEEFFRVHIEGDEDLPHCICRQCFSLVSALVKFVDRVNKVQNMYDDIRYSKDRNRIIRVHYNLVSDELFKFNSSEEESDLENNFVPDDPDILTAKSLDGIPMTEIISEEVQSTEFLDEIEHKSGIQDPIGDVIENRESNVESINSRNDLNKKKRLQIAGDELIENNSEERHTRRHKKKLQTDLSSNKEGHRGHKYSCHDCSLHFQRIDYYSIHMKQKHDIAVELNPLTCPHCHKTFTTKFKLNRHIDTHKPLSERRLYPCPQCDRKFQTKGSVSTHIKYVHKDIRSFICEECGEGTHTKTSLRGHMLVHSDLTPFECEICKKRFKTKARLKVHLDTHGTSKHICSVCGLQLNSRVTLNRHMLVHSDITPHKCDYCGRAFKRSKTLKSHLILHSGLKPYTCEFCDRTYANAANCRTHKRTSHPDELAALEASGEKPYTKNVPRLAVLKTVAQTSENLVPVISKQRTDGTKYSTSSAGEDTLIEIDTSMRENS
ncbi:zinc finger protein 626-like isoform X1 [Anastrepha ludens]|uniref:zinc finger protein 626-like isoform X1 n=2 Tax=Anastrepha ludens TaxID=28586 RepID=UPI0023AF7217|nr:zinc finger protein 626-like isoform X1 [Anastrepha ludens]